METTNSKLKILMIAHKLTRARVAEMTMCSGKSTVDRWLLPEYIDGKKNEGWRAMPKIRMAALVAELEKVRKREAGRDRRRASAGQ